MSKLELNHKQIATLIRLRRIESELLFGSTEPNFAHNDLPDLHLSTLRYLDDMGLITLHEYWDKDFNLDHPGLGVNARKLKPRWEAHLTELGWSIDLGEPESSTVFVTAYQGTGYLGRQTLTAKEARKSVGSCIESGQYQIRRNRLFVHVSERAGDMRFVYEFPTEDAAERTLG